MPMGYKKTNISKATLYTYTTKLPYDNNKNNILLFTYPLKCDSLN